ncbi:MAG: AMP-binding protein [Bryobacteraceae bacterium]
MYGWALRRLVLPVGDRITKQRLLSRLEFLREAQWWPIERVESWRNERLRELARTAYEEVPLYRRLFDSVGVHWRDIRDADDLRRLPVVTKAMLRNAYPNESTRDTGLPWRIESSSGSTGEPFLIREDSETAGWHRASFMLSLEWAGWRMGEAHIQTGASLDRGWERIAKDVMLRCHYVPSMHLDDESLDRVLDTIDRRGIRHLWGYPCALDALAQRAAAVAWNGSPMNSVVTWADQLYPHYRSRIERVFRTQVLDTYGCGEGIQISAQCGHGRHYHVLMMDTVVEYVDSTGEPVRDGEPGRVLLTRLLPGAMPFIRYEVGDVGVRAPHQVCTCGRQWELMQSITGRQTDVVVDPSGRRFFVHFFSLYLESFPEIREYQVIQTGPDSVHIRAVCNVETPDLGARVAAHLQSAGLTEMAIHFEPVSAIPLTAAGKRRWVIGYSAEPPKVAA